MSKKKKAAQNETAQEVASEEVASDECLVTRPQNQPLATSHQPLPSSHSPLDPSPYTCSCGAGMDIVKQHLKRRFDLKNNVTYYNALQCRCPKCRRVKEVEVSEPGFSQDERDDQD